MCPNPNGMNDFEIAEYILEIIFTSKLKIRVGCSGHQGGPSPKIFCMVNSTYRVFNHRPGKSRRNFYLDCTLFHQVLGAHFDPHKMQFCLLGQIIGNTVIIMNENRSKFKVLFFLEMVKIHRIIFFFHRNHVISIFYKSLNVEIHKKSILSA